MASNGNLFQRQVSLNGGRRGRRDQPSSARSASSRASVKPRAAASAPSRSRVSVNRSHAAPRSRSYCRIDITTPTGRLQEADVAVIRRRQRDGLGNGALVGFLSGAAVAVSLLTAFRQEKRPAALGRRPRPSGCRDSRTERGRFQGQSWPPSDGRPVVRGGPSSLPTDLMSPLMSALTTANPSSTFFSALPTFLPISVCAARLSAPDAIHVARITPRRVTPTPKIAQTSAAILLSSLLRSLPEPESDRNPRFRFLFPVPSPILFHRHLPVPVPNRSLTTTEIVNDLSYDIPGPESLEVFRSAATFGACLAGNRDGSDYGSVLTV